MRIIRIYWVDARGVDPEAPRVRALMTPPRLEKLKSLTVPADRARSAAAELALALGVARERNAAPAPAPWRADRRGKPFLAAGGLHISLSHAADAAVCAISETPVGVDIEGPRRMPPSLRRFVLSAQEADCPEEALLRKWVAKESCLKLTGEGIGRGMTALTEREGRILAPDGAPLAFVREAAFPMEGYHLFAASGSEFEIALERVF